MPVWSNFTIPILYSQDLGSSIFCSARIFFSWFINLAHQGGSMYIFHFQEHSRLQMVRSNFLYFCLYKTSNMVQFIFNAGHLLLLGRPPVWMMTYGFLHGLSTNLLLNAVVVQSLPLPTSKGAYCNHKPLEHSAHHPCQQGLSSQMSMEFLM